MLHLEEMLGRKDDPSEVNLAFSSPRADAEAQRDGCQSPRVPRGQLDGCTLLPGTRLSTLEMHLLLFSQRKGKRRKKDVRATCPSVSLCFPRTWLYAKASGQARPWSQQGWARIGFTALSWLK